MKFVWCCLVDVVVLPLMVVIVAVALEVILSGVVVTFYVGVVWRELGHLMNQNLLPLVANDRIVPMTSLVVVDLMSWSLVVVVVLVLSGCHRSCLLSRSLRSLWLIQVVMVEL